MNRRRLLLLLVFIAAVLLNLPAAGQFGGGGPEVDVEVFADQDAYRPGAVVRLAFAFTLTEGWHVNAHEPLEDFLIPTVLRLDAPNGAAVTEVVYPEPEVLTFDFSPEPMAVYDEEFTLGAALTLDDDIEPGTYTIPVVLHYQACDDRQCFAPTDKHFEATIEVVAATEAVSAVHSEVFAAIAFGEGERPPAPEEDRVPVAEEAVDDWQAYMDQFTVAGIDAGYLNSDEFIAFIERAEAGEGMVEGGAFAGRSLWVVAALTIIGGFLLNLTPCVLPMIPINIAVIGAGAAGGRARGAALGATYGLAIAVVYGGLGLLIVLTTGAFGAINASPWFNAAIAILFVALGLAMFNVWNLDFTRFQAKLGGRKGKKGTFAVAFFMGGVAALLAGACVAPVVIAAILFSRDLYAQGNAFGLVLPFFLGLGMALPWPVAGAGLSLVKPGKWMTYVKYAFGVLILATALYYGHLAYQQFDNTYFVDRDEVAASVAAIEEDGWHTSLAAGLAEGVSEGKPVLIDFWATWCKSCLVMNRTTFKDPVVLDALDGYVKVKYQAEVPSAPGTREVLEHFDVLGLPTYVVLMPKEA